MRMSREVIQELSREDQMLAESIAALQKGHIAQAVELLYPTFH